MRAASTECQKLGDPAPMLGTKNYFFFRLKLSLTHLHHPYRIAESGSG